MVVKKWELIFRSVFLISLMLCFRVPNRSNKCPECSKKVYKQSLVVCLHDALRTVKASLPLIAPFTLLGFQIFTPRLVILIRAWGSSCSVFRLRKHVSKCLVQIDAAIRTPLYVRRAFHRGIFWNGTSVPRTLKVSLYQ